MYKSLFIIYLALFATTCFGTIIEETGSFNHFLFSTETACEYDHWVSHISEGIAIANYNLYSPWDRQTTGFGAFHQANANELTHWNHVIQQFVAGNYNAAQDSINTNYFPYKVVKFNDTDTGRTYYLLRENLNMAYNDTQGTHDTYDDEHGSFDYGWGLYVFNPEATTPIIVTVVHPNDDYIAPYVAAKAFVEWNAMFFQIAGAGREVAWSGSYTNTNSLSDPSRIDATAYTYAYKIFCDNIRQQFNKRELSIQVHSYDWNRHVGYASNQISAGNRSDCINLPARDLSNLHEDLIHHGNPVMIPANTIGTHPNVVFNDYYAFFDSSYPVTYSNQDTSFVCNTDIDLMGYSGNRQEAYTLQGWNDYDVFDPFLHIEMDELPNCYAQTNTNLKWFYAYNQTTQTFDLTRLYDNAWAYYAPLIHNLTATLPSLFAMNDNLPPTTPTNLQIIREPNGQINLRWNRSYAYDFKTYEIMYSTQPISGLNYLLYTRDNDGILASQAETEISIPGLQIGVNYYLKIRARDYNGNLSGESNMASTAPYSALYAQNVDELNFGCVNLGDTNTLQFTITNSGNITLAGTISTNPTLFVSMSRDSSIKASRRNNLLYDIPAGSSNTFYLHFTPDTTGFIDTSIEISSNDPNHGSNTIRVSGIGFIAPQPITENIGDGCQLSWEPVEGAIAYRIYHSATLDGQFNLIDTVTGTSYILPMEQRIGFYWVTAVSN